MRSPFLFVALVISSAAHAVPAPQVYYYNWVLNVKPPQPFEKDPNFFPKRLAAYLKAKKLTDACIDLRSGVPILGDGSSAIQGVSMLMSRPLDKEGRARMIEIGAALCQGIPDCRYTTLEDKTVDNLQAEIEFRAEGPLKGSFTPFNVMQKVPNLGTSCTSGEVKDSLNHAFEVKKALVQKMESSAGVPIEMDFPVAITPFDAVKIRGQVGKMGFVYPAPGPRTPAEERVMPDGSHMIIGDPENFDTTMRAHYRNTGSNIVPSTEGGVKYDNPYGH